MSVSLRRQILVLWITLALLGAGIAGVMLGLYRTGSRALSGAGSLKVEQASLELAQRFERYRSTFPSGLDLADSTVRTELELIGNLVLQNFAGVEGGLWQLSDGPLTYAFPTHEGDAPKKDVPAAEKNRISATVHSADLKGAPQTMRYDGTQDILFIQARPITGEPQHVVAWTMTRMHRAEDSAYRQLLTGLLLLSIAAIGSGLWLIFSLRKWGRSIALIEASLLQPHETPVPAVPLVGEVEIDRLTSAFNRMTRRFEESRQNSDRLTHDLTRAERLAGLGRMVAGVAHELGNPIAAMRLRIDNARGQDEERQRSALRAIEIQVRRIEELLQRMNLLSKVNEANMRDVKLAPWLRGCWEQVAPHAEERRLTFHVEGVDQNLSGRFDSDLLGRAVENLLLNAVQHSPDRGEIRLIVRVEAKTLNFTVADQGVGVPAENRERIFEPFVSGRANGTGLGLMLVQEAVAAHRGTVVLDEDQDHSGARFTISIPWHKS